MSSCDLITVAQAARIFPIFTESAIRNLINKSEQNGLASAIQRLGSRVYIVEEEFRKWMKTSQGASNG